MNPLRTVFAACLALAVLGLPSFLAADNYPFPQNQAQPHRVDYPSYSNADVQAQYNAWVAEQVTTTGAGPAGASGVVGGVTEYQRVQRNGDPTLTPYSTVSEGIGYGMVIAVYMDNQALFDDLWNYEQEHLDGNGLMNWYIDPDGQTDPDNGGGAATDADEDMAWALVMAHYQWGDSSAATNPSGAGYDYTTLATTQITDIYNTEIESGTYVVKPGDSWGGSSATNPSYFDPAEYKVFAQFTGNNGWLSVADEAYTVLYNSLNAAAGNQSDGLDPAWCDAAGVTVTAFSGAPTNYQYDACRTPFRVFKDWAFFGDARSISFTAMNNGFFVPIGAANIVDGYALTGAQDPQYDVGGVTEEAASFVGPATCAAMDQTATADAAFVQTGYDLLTNTAWAANHLDGDMVVGGQYYDQSWAVLSLLMMSGNYLDYAPLPTPTATPTPAPTVNPCQTQIRLDCGASAAYTSSATGLVWAADQQYVPGSAPGAAGSYGYVSWAAGTAATSSGTVTGTSDPALYQTQRYGTQLGYDFSVPNGPATVTCYWAETYFDSAGQRVFSVAINGTTVETNLDLYAASGGENVAYTATFPVTVSDGVISVSMTASANNAVIQAISIAAGPLCTPSASPSATPSPTPSPSRSASPSPTPSPSPSLTPTPSATPTVSPSASPTLSATPSATPTASPSTIPTLSATASPSPTASAASATPSPTWTASTTATESPGPSASASATDSPTADATATPSATQSASPLPSATASPASTWTATPPPSPSGTASATEGATALPSATATASAAPSGTPSPVPTGTLSPTASASATPTEPATETPAPAASPSASPTASPSAVPSRTPVPTGTATPGQAGSPASAPAGAGAVEAVWAVPNPNPDGLAVELSAPGQRVRVQVFTKALVQVLDFEAPAPAAGWNSVPLPAGWKALPNGLYYAAVRVVGGVGQAKPVFARAMVLR